jgi:diguanylate cyclase (GGDEF)-like protein
VIERERARELLEAHAAGVRAMSVRDELTGLYNRRGFHDLAAQQFERAQRTGSPAVLFFADLNGMKPINDELGHEEGDRALVDIADVWRKVFRSSDIVARLGGDEFVVFAVGVDAVVAVELRARISREVDAFNALASRPYRLSVSVGVALYDPAAPRTLEALVSAADAAMYEQKKRRA